KPGKRSSGMMIGVAAVVLLLLLGGGGLAVYLMTRDKDDTHKVVENPKPPPPIVGGRGGVQQPPPPVVGPQTGRRGQTDASTKPEGGAKPEVGETVPVLDTKVSRNTIYQYILKSTAWIITKHGEGAAMGTGSLIDKENRLVLTNYHVVYGLEDFVVFFPT